MPTALVIEDERATGELLSEILRRRGFEPKLFLEGVPALAWVRQYRPDLILLDLMLPDIDGYRICEDLKLDRQTNLIPIIMVTARDQPQDRVHGLQVGANSYIVKPFSVDELNETITQVLAWREDIQKLGTEGEIHFRFQSDLRYLDQVNNLLSSLFLFTGLTETQIRHLMTAIRELGLNAIEWGHRRQIERIVTMTYRIDGEKMTITIRDTGPGFDPNNLPHAARLDDPLAHMHVREELGLRAGGFGILMSRGLVDELKYNDKGNEVQLVKYLKNSSADGVAASGS